MRSLLGLCGVMALAACGGETTSRTYFVPRAAIAALSDSGAAIVGTHDSGVLVEVGDARGAAKIEALGDSFRFDEWREEKTRYNFDSMQRKLREFEQRYPDLVKLETYGTSRGGKPEYVLRLGQHAATAAKPEIMITAATHGNETITVDVVLGLIEKLLVGYGSDERLTRMVDEHMLHFIPVVCVDSYIARSRYNEGRDPNRDYPYPDMISRQSVGAIRDLIAYFESRPFAGSMDFHAAASMIMFPWAYTYDRIPRADYDYLDDLTTRMAATNGFAHGDIASTIYVAKGSSADYYYWKKRTMATAIEVSHNLAAEDGKADEIVEENTESTWLFIESFR